MDGYSMKKYVLIFASVLPLSSYCAEFAECQKDRLFEGQKTAIADAYSMFDLLNAAVQIDYVQLSEDQISTLADVAVRGRIESITAGRSILDSRNVFPLPLRTSIIKMNVESVLKGKPADYVYIEYTTAAMSPDVLDAVKYDGEILVYLQAQRADRYGNEFTVTNCEEGVMNEVEQLYDLVTSAALITFEEGKVPGDITKRRPLVETDAR
jgi:hypothetical protein